MSDTWDWPPEMTEALEDLYKIWIPNPEPNRQIKFSEMVGGEDELQP